MTDLTDNIEKFYKNIDNLRYEIRFTNNNNRFALKYYLDEFEYKFKEFQNSDPIQKLPLLKKQKLNDLIIFQKKINNILKKSKVSSNNITINVPILDNELANLYFKTFFELLDIYEMKKLLNHIFSQIIDKIYYPQFIVIDGNNNKVININPLEKLYYKQNFDSKLLKQLKIVKESDTISSLAKSIINSDYYKNIVGNINSSNKELKINLFYSNIVNYIAKNLFKHENLINEKNSKVQIKNINTIFPDNSDYSNLSKLIYLELIKSNSNSILSLNDLFKTKIINTNTADLITNNKDKVFEEDTIAQKNTNNITFLQGHFNNIANIPLYKILKSNRNELINSIPKNESEQKFTHFVLKKYLDYNINDIVKNKDHILLKYDKYNSVFPNVQTILNNITQIKYNKFKKKFEISFSNIIKYNKNFIYYNVLKIVDRINKYKINNTNSMNENSINLKKIYIVLSLELLKQIDLNLNSMLNDSPNTNELKQLLLHNKYINPIIYSINNNINKFISNEDNKKENKKNLSLNINFIDIKKYPNSTFIDNILLFSYQHLDRDYLKDTIKQHLENIFSFDDIFDELFYNFDNFDLLAELIKNNRINFEINKNNNNRYITKINKLNEDEKSMIIDLHYSYIDQNYLEGLKKQNILSFEDVSNYNKKKLSQQDLIEKIQITKLTNILNEILEKLIDKNIIKTKISNCILFIIEKINVNYNFVFNQKISISNIYNINNNIDINTEIKKIFNDIRFIEQIEKVLLNFIKEYIFYKCYKKTRDDDQITEYMFELIMQTKINLFLEKKRLNTHNQNNYNID